MRYLRNSAILLFCFGLMIIVGCVSYSKEIKKALTRAHDKKQFGVYSFRGNPVGNFGVGTIYEDEFTEKDTAARKHMQPQEAWLLAHPNSWYADAVTDEERETLDKKIFEPGSMGSIALKEKISTKLKLNATIPNLSQVLDAGATLDYEKGVKVTLKASQAINRQMNLSEFKAAIAANKMQPYVGELLDRSNILIASKDIVLEGYSAEIEVDQTINPALNAKLNEAVGKSLGADTSLKLGITKKHEGSYEVVAMKPVVAAVLYVRPPKKSMDVVAKIIADPLGEKESFDDWEEAVISYKILDPVEAFLAEKGLPKVK